MADTNLIPGQAVGDEIAESGTSSPRSGDGDTWLKFAKDAFKRSTTYMENNYRRQFEDGLRLFNSQHPRDSKYNSEAYKYRSRIFRPKTRSVVRKHEATAAMAFFSNPDVVSIDPVDQEDPAQALSASITKELLQYRLTSKVNGIPWFITVIGALQDAMTVGICASLNYWDYATRKQEVPTPVQFMGQQFTIMMEKDVPYVDKPCCELIPINHLRFDPAAKWYDVVGTSPYFIVQLPMYLRDVLDRMENGYGKGEAWKSLDERTILSARITEDDPVQQARDGRKEDPDKLTSEVNEFDVVMVHLNFIKTEDGTFTYYTLKDTHLLSDPVLVKEAFLHGEIPVTLGFCVLETHKALPHALTNLGAQLQAEANEIANQRLDNVKFVLNKRWIVRRGSNVDTDSIVRNIPGGVTMANDVEKDVKEFNWQDVTSSSFQEQDRLNVDFDDLMGGGLNNSSVMTNRKLNETVGGMQIMAQGANQLTEYAIRLFVETWLEPTLRQLIKLEQYYESDMTVIAIAAKKAKAWQQFGQSPDLDKLLQQELTTTVNVGMGATDPKQRFQSFMQASQAYTLMVQQGPPDMNLPEVRKELFGLAGFKDSMRFFNPQVDARFVQAQKMLQQAEGLAKQVVQAAKDRILSREHQLDMRELEMGSDLRKQQDEHLLELRQQNFEQVQDSKKQAVEFRLNVDAAQQEAALAAHEAKVETHLNAFKAYHEAALSRFEARQEQERKDRESAAKEAALRRPKRVAKKRGPGEWEISEE